MRIIFLFFLIISFFLLAGCEYSDYSPLHFKSPMPKAAKAYKLPEFIKSGTYYNDDFSDNYFHVERVNDQQCLFFKFKAYTIDSFYRYIDYLNTNGYSAVYREGVLIRDSRESERTTTENFYVENGLMVTEKEFIGQINIKNNYYTISNEFVNNQGDGVLRHTSEYRIINDIFYINYRPRVYNNDDILEDLGYWACIPIKGTEQGFRLDFLINAYHYLEKYSELFFLSPIYDENEFVYYADPTNSQFFKLMSNSELSIGFEFSKIKSIRNHLLGNQDDPPSYHLISVGISNYENDYMIHPLKGPAKQAYEFARIFEASGLISKGDPTIIVNENATTDSIISSIANLRSNPKIHSNDIIIFYFSGHGMSFNGENGICPYEYAGANYLLEDNIILEELNKIDVKHKICIIESCKNKAGQGTPLDKNLLEILHNKRKNISDDFIFMTSCKPGQESLESNEGWGYYSFFLLEGLKGEADFNGDKLITVQELYEFCRYKVTTTTQGDQTPQINISSINSQLPIIINK